MKDSSNFRNNISKLDIDPGYFCKYFKDQIVLNYIEKNNINSIIDFGCDTAYIYDILHNRNYDINYTGVDKNLTNNVKNMQSNEDFKFVHTDDLHNYINNCYLNYDVWLLLDVIEHMKNEIDGFNLLNSVIDKMQSKSILIISTPNKINNILNWPQYHKYEYNHDQILQFMSTKNCLLELFCGWSMSNEIYLSNNFHSYIPIEIDRVLKAYKNPEISRDVLFIYKKN